MNVQVISHQELHNASCLGGGNGLKVEEIKVFQAQQYYSSKFCKVFRIHGREVFVETPFNFGQCFARVFMEGTEFFDEENLVHWQNASTGT
jgi:hypothetical protein